MSSNLRKVDPARTVLFLNGPLGSLERAGNLDQDILIGVDGGTEHIFALSLIPDLVVGDLDSISAETLARLNDLEIPIHRHPPERDQYQSDLELALQVASTLQPRELLILGGIGGRIDHTLVNILVLSLPVMKEFGVNVIDGETLLTAVHGGSTIDLSANPGAHFSLIPLSPTVTGVTLTGTKWPLNNATLNQGATLTLSNMAEADSIRIQVGSGVLLVVLGL